MKARPTKRSRKATWLAFGLVALAAVSASAQDSNNQKEATSTTDITPVTTGVDGVSSEATGASASSQELGQAAAEAIRAYKQAIHTLSALAAHPSPYEHLYSAPRDSNSKSIFSSFLPNLQGQGPIGSAVRILGRIQQQIFHGILGGDRDGIPFPGSRRKEEEMHRKAIKVVDLLQHSAELGNMDALYTLAQISLLPPTSHFPSNPKLAYDSYTTHASLTGNASSQAFLAFFYATGYQNIVPVDQARAQLYYTFAANGGDKAHKWHWDIGIGDCDRAVDWYEHASEQAMAKFRAGPPGGLSLPLTPTRLSDLDGGIYGPGASVASTGTNANRAAIRAGVSRASGETWEDIIDYYLFNADRGETDFAYRLGKIYYQGSIYATAGGIASGSEGVGAITRDYVRAKHYFEQIVRQVWPRDPPNPLQHRAAAPSNKDEGAPVGYASASAGYLGRMYLRGEGVKADPAMAKMWFERGADYSDRECLNGLGVIWRDALVPGTKPDLKKATQFFTGAVGQELAEAQVNIAKYHFGRGELGLATTCFETAVRLGSPFEAFYYLGQIHSAQSRTPEMPKNVASSSCAMAVSFHKLVSERGVWNDDLLRDAEAAWFSGTDRGKEVALLKWWIAAERGSEIAQNNLAYALDQDKSILRLTRFSPMTASNDTARLALTQWTRAAAQRNVDALVKVGDYYYHGLGVPEYSESVRFEKAARYYQSAADTQMSALAMWNLGWMYENGVGVPRDFHLAKRHYDLALDANSEAYIPIILSLGKLYVRSIWHTLLGGADGLNLWYDDEDTSQPKEEVREIDEGSRQTTPDQAQPEQHVYSDDEEGPWYLGKAREEFDRRKNDQARGHGDDEDPIQWARDRRNAEERESEFGPDDYFEGGLREGAEDNFSETMLLILLCLTVSVLIYVRTRMVDRMRRDQQGRDQDGQRAGVAEGGNGAAGAANGAFPPPGDPARDEWVILR
ncbi:hypothetical protein IW261DRAFT_1453903 [Armillaria novae-zelandiae]|uniref:HCP-like protein n=1 Tax=Armillaria novae-zelandiae TaxID=153914 RepID=A0AA39PKV3_9AGAR|nr:hypothetical protein IW261DRAFT_1453903 [Armillaria novae-zelandiae]